MTRCSLLDHSQSLLNTLTASPLCQHRVYLLCMSQNSFFCCFFNATPLFPEEGKKTYGLKITEVKKTHLQCKYVQGWLKCPSSFVTLATELSTARPTLQNMVGVGGRLTPYTFTALGYRFFHHVIGHSGLGKSILQPLQVHQAYSQPTTTAKVFHKQAAMKMASR